MHIHVYVDAIYKPIVLVCYTLLRAIYIYLFIYMYIYIYSCIHMYEALYMYISLCIHVYSLYIYEYI